MSMDFFFDDDEEELWSEEDEKRMDIIGQNGNTGEHYDTEVPTPKKITKPKSKQKKVKEVDWLKVMGSGVELAEEVEEVIKRKKIALFDFLGDINQFKKNILRNDPNAHVDYAPYIINVGMSLQADTVFYANEMNKFHFLPKQMQYDFLIKAVHKRKRFSKWPKKFKGSTEIDLVKSYYGINSSRAMEYLEFMTSDDLDLIKRKSYTGGKTKFV